MWLLFISVNIMHITNYCTLVHPAHTACTQSTLISWNETDNIKHLHNWIQTKFTWVGKEKGFVLDFGNKWNIFCLKCLLMSYTAHWSLHRDLNKRVGFIMSQRGSPLVLEAVSFFSDFEGY